MALGSFVSGPQAGAGEGDSEMIRWGIFSKEERVRHRFPKGLYIMENRKMSARLCQKPEALRNTSSTEEETLSYCCLQEHS